MINETTKKQLQFLGLKHLSEDWDINLKTAKKKQPSYHKFLADIIEKEYFEKKERARLSRIKKANIPRHFIIETFPFDKQSRVRKRIVMDLYDSMNFMTQKQELIFIGPTGCGKTGLATSYLIHAINQGYRGYFIEFSDLLKQLRTSKGDYTINKLLKKLQSYEILLIDEFGYNLVEKEIVGSFFELIKKRNSNTTTLITTQLGFEEWEGFLKDKHLTAAIVDRITVKCTIFNLKNCISIRPQEIVYAARK